MTELSPAAQAVLNAFLGDAEYTGLQMDDMRENVAAALRAAAELLSREVDAPKVDGSKYAGLWHSFDYLNAIADELETK